MNIPKDLEKLGAMRDEDFPLTEAALLLSSSYHDDMSLERYYNHLKKLVSDVSKEFETRVENGAADDLETRRMALKDVLVEEYEYTGDEDDYDHLDNADLIRVIDRRKGMPITLAIIYIHVGRALGWRIEGLNIPGHFVVRLDKDGERLIFDPFHGCKILQAPDLRQIVKENMGPQAELSAEYFEPAPNKTILIRLQNNIKIRQIEMEDYAGALKTVRSMQAIDPDEYRLLLDAGVLYARTNQPQSAIDVLEDYIRQAPDDRNRHDAALLLQQIRQNLN